MSVWLASVDKYQPAIWHQGALQLVGRGFLCPEHLDGLQPKDVARFSADEKVKCLLQAALQSACGVARLRRKHIASQVEAGRPVAASAEAAATLVRSSQAAPLTLTVQHSLRPCAALRLLRKNWPVLSQKCCSHCSTKLTL